MVTPPPWQPGFLGKLVFVDPAAVAAGSCLDLPTSADAGALDYNADGAAQTAAASGAGSGSCCTVWVLSAWSTRAQWQAVPVPALIAEQGKFEAIYGSAPTRTPYPTAQGMDVLQQTGPF